VTNQFVSFQLVEDFETLYKNNDGLVEKFPIIKARIFEHAEKKTALIRDPNTKFLIDLKNCK